MSHALIQIQDLSLSLGNKLLLDQANIQITAGERIGLVGRNGAGKTTLMKLIAGLHTPDKGQIITPTGLRIHLVLQSLPTDLNQSVANYVAQGLGSNKDLLAEFEALCALPEMSSAQVKRLQQLEHEISAQHAWDLTRRVTEVLAALQLDASKAMSELSGGWLKRAQLAQALLAEPDVLLLDEPTNHLDIGQIVWLEQYLLSTKITLLFVSHDRSFLSKICSKIVDLDRGKLISYPGEFNKYTELKQKALEEEVQQQQLAKKKLATEEAWLRQGVKARRKRNQGRLQRLVDLRQNYKSRQQLATDPKFDISAGARSGEIVAKFTKVNFAYNDQAIIKDFNFTLLRGARLGLVGPNGCGKSTLIKLLLDELQPDTGKIKHGTNLSIAYFDQARSKLDPTNTLMANVSEHGDEIQTAKGPISIYSYLQNFLFSPEQLRQPITKLSGGEQNRLLLAKIFAKPVNLLILDEPTNDLDIESLELLEELIENFAGTVILVSHDRQFIDNVTTNILAFESNGKLTEYIGGFTELAKKLFTATPSKIETKASKAKLETQSEQDRKATKQKQNRIKSLEQKITKKEAEIAKLHDKMGAADFYDQAMTKQQQTTKQLHNFEQELQQFYDEWEQLLDD